MDHHRGPASISLIVSVALAVVLLRRTAGAALDAAVAINGLFGIGIGAFFAWRTGEAKDFFLPGILYNAGYAVAMLLSIVVRWPLVGFVIGSVIGDPTAWRHDPAVVRLCAGHLAADAAVLVRVVVQLPLYLTAGTTVTAWASRRSRWAGRCRSRRSPPWLAAGRGRTPVRSAVA